MKTPIESQKLPEDVKSSEVKDGRRRLLKAGVALVPVISTIKPTPVLACNCKHPSGFSVSGNYSQTRSTVCAPGEITNGPTFWKNQLKLRSRSLTSETLNLKFVQMYSAGTKTGRSDMTVKTALDGSAHASELELKFIAAWLNNGVPASRYVFQAMWNQGVMGLGYTPSASQLVWKEAEIQAYMNYVMKS